MEWAEILKMARDKPTSFPYLSFLTYNGNAAWEFIKSENNKRKGNDFKHWQTWLWFHRRKKKRSISRNCIKGTKKYGESVHEPLAGFDSGNKRTRMELNYQKLDS